MHEDRLAERDRVGSTRMCAACRLRAPREVLHRYVLADGAITIDVGRTAPGRGLNLGPSPSCLERAVKRGAFQRQWRMPISREGLELITLRSGAALRERLARYLASAWARGGLAAVAGIDGVEPREARVLWQAEELAEVVRGIPPARATSARIAARIKALTGAVSEFTFARAGAMKRRPEAPEACEALERCGGGAIPRADKRAMTRGRRVAVVGPKGPDGRNG